MCPGPIVGGFLAETQGWRWILGLIAILSGVVSIATTLVTRETYAPFILRRRAKALSRMTGRVYVSRLDAGQQPKTLAQELSVSLTRPLILLFCEPIVLLTSLYISIVYGTLYMFFAGFPIVFEVTRGWSQGIAGLPFVGVAIGVCLATLAAGVDNKRYVRLCATAEAGGFAVEPEARLATAMVGSIVLPIGLFLFAWTTYPSVHWIVPIIGAMFFSCGLVMVFISLMSYLVDSCTFLSLLHVLPTMHMLTCVQMSSMLLLYWQPTRCFGLYSARRFRFLPPKCTKVSEINGRVPFLHSWCLGACLFRFCSISTARKYAPSANMLPKQQIYWR